MKNIITKFACTLLLALSLTTGPGWAQSSPEAGNAGTTTAPPSGNYPGSGSSPQPGVPPPAKVPSGPTPGSASAGNTNSPITGVTPGTGDSPNPQH